MRVLNFGSLNLDYVYSVDHMVTPGETLASYSMNTFCGGKGLNQSIALAKAGVEVFHAGLIGEEGDLLLDTCKKGGVQVAWKVRAYHYPGGQERTELYSPVWRGESECDQRVCG